jgi:hypothetical protein
VSPWSTWPAMKKPGTGAHAASTEPATRGRPGDLGSASTRATRRAWLAVAHLTGTWSDGPAGVGPER